MIGKAEFEEMLKAAQSDPQFKGIPAMILRVALHASLRDEEQKGRLYRYGKKIDTSDVAPEFLRRDPVTEIKGMEIIEPDESSTVVQDVSETAGEPVSPGVSGRPSPSPSRGKDDADIDGGSQHP
jgi:hypothetical protein